MGLDVALGVIILVAAFRGWFQGFVAQAVRLGSLVAAVYLAVHVRDYAKPHVLPYLNNIRRVDLIDPILWWVSAVLTWLVLGGAILLIIKMTRRPEIPGISRSNQNDQYAGFLVGGIKGALIAIFLTAGIQNYAMDLVKNVSFVDEQVKTSWALKWNESYHPAYKIWTSKPVRHFVEHIQRMGLQAPDAPVDPAPGEELEAENVLRTASRAEQAAAESGTDSSARISSKTASPAAEASRSHVEKVDPQTSQAERPADPNAN
jgi:membrane protein required for colicin V production